MAEAPRASRFAAHVPAITPDTRQQHHPDHHPGTRQEPPIKHPRPVLAAASRQTLTPRNAAWLVLRRTEKRSADDRALLADLRRHAPELDEAVALAEEFTGLIREHAPDRLDPWLKRARDSTIRQLQSFAKRLGSDYAAVQAAVALAWSNGQTEGRKWGKTPGTQVQQNKGP